MTKPILLLFLVYGSLGMASCCRSEEPRSPFPNSPNVVSMLYDSNDSSQRIMILDLHNVQQMVTKGPNSYIVNLTVSVCLARKVTFELDQATQKVTCKIVEAISDTIPYFPNQDKLQPDGVTHVGVIIHVVDGKDLIRINGKVMDYITVAKKIQVIPTVTVK